MAIIPSMNIIARRFQIWLLLFVGVSVIVPVLLNFLGVDFGVTSSSLKLALGQQNVHGLLVHTLLMWTATCLAFFTFVLAFFHYYVKRDIVIPVLGISLLWGGLIDMFQTLSADRFLLSSAEEMQVIPFTWAIGRTFGILTLLMGVMIVMVRKYKGSATGNVRFFVLLSIALGLASFAIMDLLTSTTNVPETIFPNSFISRPWDTFPLFIYAIAGIWVFRAFHRDRQDHFSFSIWLSVIPDIVAQLHMAFGSVEIFDNSYILAHFLKVISYLVPGIGLLKDYFDTNVKLQEEMFLRTKVENSHRRLAQLVDGTQDMIALLDDKGFLRYVNQAFAAQIGLETNYPVKLEFSSLFSGYNSVQKAKEMGERAFLYNQDRGEIELMTLDCSRLIPVEYVIFPLGDEERLLGVILKDITGTKQQVAERLRHEKHLQRVISARSAELAAEKMKLRTELAEGERLKARLVEAQKMEAIGQLTTGIAHEINNPIGFVRVNLKVLHDYFETFLEIIHTYENNRDQVNVVRKEKKFDTIQSDIKDLLQESSLGLDRVVAIIKGLKNYAHPADNAFEELHLKELIEDSLQILSSSLKNHELIWDCDIETPKIVGQRVALTQVFVNLLHNASQAIDGNGQIQIRIKSHGKFIQVSIIDSGKGIPVENYSKIFNPFFTTKGVGEGTGLGLYISYGIIEKHKGEILFFSEANKGTTFQVLLPKKIE